MNHQPFRDWLVGDEELSAEQSQHLNTHLDECEPCRQLSTAWRELETTIQKAPMLVPVPGFTSRWEVKLAYYRARREKQQGMVIVGIMLSIIMALSILFLLQFWSVLQSPGPFIAAWFSGYIDALSFIFRVQELINPFTWNIPVYAFISLFFIVGIASFMSVLWLATYRRLSFARRSI